MESKVQSVASRDTAFRAIGRNIINFQKLEHCLKVLARFSAVDGPANALGEAITKRVAKTSGFTLGQAIGEWLKVAGGTEVRTSVTTDLFDPWISMSINPVIDSEILTEHGQALSALAIERNNLVHHDLAQFNFDSEEECRRLVGRLDSQNAKILEQLSVLAPVITEIRDFHEWIKWPETLDELVEEFNRQLGENGT